MTPISYKYIAITDLSFRHANSQRELLKSVPYFATEAGVECLAKQDLRDPATAEMVYQVLCSGLLSARSRQLLCTAFLSDDLSREALPAPAKKALQNLKNGLKHLVNRTIPKGIYLLLFGAAGDKLSEEFRQFIDANNNTLRPGTLLPGNIPQSVYKYRELGIIYGIEPDQYIAGRKFDAMSPEGLNLSIRWQFPPSHLIPDTPENRELYLRTLQTDYPENAFSHLKTMYSLQSNLDKYEEMFLRQQGKIPNVSSKVVLRQIFKTHKIEMEADKDQLSDTDIQRYKQWIDNNRHRLVISGWDVENPTHHKMIQHHIERGFEKLARMTPQKRLKYLSLPIRSQAGPKYGDKHKPLSYGEALFYCRDSRQMLGVRLPATSDNPEQVHFMLKRAKDYAKRIEARSHQYTPVYAYFPKTGNLVELTDHQLDVIKRFHSYMSPSSRKALALDCDLVPNPDVRQWFKDILATTRVSIINRNNGYL